MPGMGEPRGSLAVNLSGGVGDRADAVSLEKPRQLEFTEQDAEERELHKERTPAICKGPQFNNDQCTSVRKMLEDGVRTTQTEQKEQTPELMKAGNITGFYKPEWKILITHGVLGGIRRRLLLQ